MTHDAAATSFLLDKERKRQVQRVPVLACRTLFIIVGQKWFNWTLLYCRCRLCVDDVFTWKLSNCVYSTNCDSTDYALFWNKSWVELLCTGCNYNFHHSLIQGVICTDEPCQGLYHHYNCVSVDAALDAEFNAELTEFAHTWMKENESRKYSKWN